MQLQGREAGRALLQPVPGAVRAEGGGAGVVPRLQGQLIQLAILLHQVGQSTRGIHASCFIRATLKGPLCRLIFG